MELQTEGELFVDDGDVNLEQRFHLRVLPVFGLESLKHFGHVEEDNVSYALCDLFIHLANVVIPLFGFFWNFHFFVCAEIVIVDLFEFFLNILMHFETFVVNFIDQCFL